MVSLVDSAPAPSRAEADPTSGTAASTAQQVVKETPTALLMDVSNDAPPLRSILRSPQEFKPRAAPPAADAAVGQAASARSALTDDDAWKRMVDTLPTPHTQSRIAGAEWQTAKDSSLHSANQKTNPSPPGGMPDLGPSSSRQAYVEEVDEAKTSSRATSRAASVKASSKAQLPSDRAPPPPAQATPPAAEAPSRAPSVSHNSRQSEVKASSPAAPVQAPTISLATPTAGIAANQRRSTSASTQAAPNYPTSTTYPPSLSAMDVAASEVTGITMPDKPSDMPNDVYQALRREAQAQARRIVEEEMQKRGLAESEFTTTAFTDAETYRTAARQSEPPPSHVQQPGPPFPEPVMPSALPSSFPPIDPMAYAHGPQTGIPLPSPPPPPQGLWSGALPDWQDSEAIVAAWRDKWAPSQEPRLDAYWPLPPAPPSVLGLDPSQAVYSGETPAEHGNMDGATYEAMAPSVSFALPTQQPPPPHASAPYATWQPSQPPVQPIRSTNDWYVRNGGGELPGGWVAEYDDRYAAWYFVDQNVYPPRSTWYDPRQSSPRQRSFNSRRHSEQGTKNHAADGKRGSYTMPGAYDAWADDWREEESALELSRQLEAYEAAQQARGHRGPVAAEMDRERDAAKRARRIYEEATEAPLRLVEAVRQDDAQGIVKAEEMAARAAGARDRMREDDALRAAAVPVGLQGYEGPTRGWDVWGRPREAWMSAPGPDGGRPGFAALPMRAPSALAVGAPPIMQPDGQWVSQQPRISRGQGILDWRFARANARPRLGLKGSHTPTPFGLPEAVFSIDMALRASHATEALEGVNLGSAPYPGPPATTFPPNNSQRRALANVPYYV